MFYINKRWRRGGEEGGAVVFSLTLFILCNLLLYSVLFLFWKADLEGLFSFVEIDCMV